MSRSHHCLPRLTSIATVGFLLVAFAICAKAQERDRQLRVPFQVTVLGEPPEQAWYIPTRNRGFAEIGIHANSWSLPRLYVGSEPLTFYTRIEGGNDNGEYRPVFRARVPAGIRRPLVILDQNANEQGVQRWAAVTLEGDPSVFPYGSFLFFNASSRESGVAVGEAGRRLRPGTHTVFTGPFGSDPVGIQVAIAGEDDEWLPVMETFSIPRQGRRLLLVIGDRHGDLMPGEPPARVVTLADIEADQESDS